MYGRRGPVRTCCPARPCVACLIGPLAVWRWTTPTTPRKSRLLHLLNGAAEAGCQVLLAARAAPSRWPTRLPDLASRLRAVTAVDIAPPGDAMLRTLFASLLAGRQLAVPDQVQHWLLLRLPREPGALREVAARLDRTALAAGRRVTHAIAAQVLAELV